MSLEGEWRQVRSVGLEFPKLNPNANYECRFCLFEFTIFPTPTGEADADLNKDVIAHVRECHQSHYWAEIGEDDHWVREICQRKTRNVLGLRLNAAGAFLKNEETFDA